MSVQILQHAAETRRSVYALNKNLPISQKEVVQIVEHALLHTPSSFHSQSTRMVVLFGAEHEKLWDIAKDELRKSVLFFEDQSVVKGLQEQFAAYADNFPVWAEHADAMVQYAVWTTLAAAGVGANLQHYNLVIDVQVAQTWNIPADWKLRAQMVLGGIAAPAGEKTFADVPSRLRVYGA